MKIFTLSIVAALILSGCAHRDNIWVNSNPSKHDFKQDRYACLQSSSQATPPAAARGFNMFGDPITYDVNAANRENLFKACMEARDWSLQDILVRPGETVAVR
jgi:hypothetical protein